MNAVPRRVVLSLLSLAQALASAAAGLSITVTAPAIETIAGSEPLAGWGQTSTIAGAACLSVPLARSAARYGRRASLVMAFAVAAAGALTAAAAAASGVLVVLLLGLLLLGAGTVAALALRFAAADAAETSGTRARYVGIVLACATIGSLVGPNLSTATASVGAGAPYVLIACLYALAAGSAAFACSPEPPAHALRSVPRDDADRRPVARAERRLAVVPILVMTAGHMGMVALMGMAPVHLGHAGVTGSGAGLVMSAHLVAMYAASPLFGALVRRMGSCKPGVAGLLLGVAACGVLLVLGSDGVWFGVGLAGIGFGWSLGMVASSVALAELAPSIRLRSQGRGDLALNVGGGIASLVAGLLLALLGYEGLTAVVGAGLLVAATAAAVLSAGNARGDSTPGRTRPRSAPVTSAHGHDP